MDKLNSNSQTQATQYKKMTMKCCTYGDRTSFLFGICCSRLPLCANEIRIHKLEEWSTNKWQQSAGRKQAKCSRRASVSTKNRRARMKISELFKEIRYRDKRAREDDVGTNNSAGSNMCSNLRPHCGCAAQT